MKKKARQKLPSKKVATAEHLMRAIEVAVEKAPFMGFSPFQTYSDASNRYLLNEAGRPIYRNPENSDADALWRIGHEAYRLLEVKDRQDFLTRYEEFKRSISMWEKLVVEMAADGRIIDKAGIALCSKSLSLTYRTEAEILAYVAQILDQFREAGLADVIDERRGEHLLFACLREIDNAITGMGIDGRGAVASVVSAVNALADAQAELNGSPQFQKVRRKMAYEAAVVRHQKDPKAADKKFVFECYRDWRANPSRYKSKAEFARDMLEKCQHLKSQKKIEDWVREWDAAAKNGTLPAE
ncbi:hypothetical protein [Solimonas sp. SE-A11]|uniref:hypothetical protein n=1 Tax=Solimonas sp. SE-A11 TaxID=3054954 RepID=UPI00259CE7CC|nr:hypothetical protein [Solimonas sp. SE-A11]MDM4772407.1 hypothetical protein [Solimonas sp. SE-A11]